MDELQAGIELGPVTLYYFSLLVIVGLAAGTAVSYFRARRLGEDPEFLIDFLIWGLGLGLVLARIFFVWNPPPSIRDFYDRQWYISHPLDLQTGLVAVWSGGLGMAGGLLGATLGFGFVLWRHKLQARSWARIVVPGALFALAIMPWGNLFIRQMVGAPTHLAWGVIVDPAPVPYDDPAAFPPGSTGFHPLPAYLALWAAACLAAYFFLDYTRPSIRKPWPDLAASLGYLAGVFAADFLRIDVTRGLLGLTGMQWMALLLAAVSLLWRLIRYNIVFVDPPDLVADGGSSD